MNDMILLKPGELVLKGLNRHFFEDRLRANVARRLRSLGEFRITSVQSTVYVEPLSDDIDMEEAFRRCTAMMEEIQTPRNMLRSPNSAMRSATVEMI